ncbi:MAG: hypothetical protein HYZ63_04075 [Candidatus Andersenbacteria bacterium]|nr:hypothetical protein [Candidatus Andersenbacteria bacterium]
MELRTALVILHVIGTVLGAGAATVTDFLFFKFAKDGQLDKDEYGIVKAVSSIVWIGLFLLVATGFGFMMLYVGDMGGVRASYNLDKIWAKLIIVMILLCNGFALHYKVLPLFASRLHKSFATPQFIKKSTVIFTAGAISGVSWYSALILGAWRALDASLGTILAVYACILAGAIITSNIGGRYLLHHIRKHPH